MVDFFLFWSIVSLIHLNLLMFHLFTLFDVEDAFIEEDMTFINERSDGSKLLNIGLYLKGQILKVKYGFIIYCERIVQMFLSASLCP